MFDTLRSRIYQGSQFIKDIENAKRLIKENKNNDFQHRF